MNQRENKKSNSITQNYGRLPPQNQAAEKTILSHLLNASDRIVDVLEILPSSEYFYNNVHSEVFQSIINIHALGWKVDIVSVMTELSKRGILEEIGGAFEVTKLAMMQGFDYAIINHAIEVVECFKRREVIRISGELLSKAYDSSEDLETFVHDSDRELVEVMSKGDIVQSVVLKDLIVPFNEALHAAQTKKREVKGVSTGYIWLDEITNGWQPGRLIILAARPSVGKTAFALNLGMNATLGDNPAAVGIFSLEMEKDELMNRIVSAVTLTDIERIEKGNLSPEEYNHVQATLDKVARMSIHIDDSPNLTIGQLRSKAKRMKRKFGIGMLIIDYLQLMAGETKGANRESEISKISRGLKVIAKELKIPVIALSQLSRAVETRTGDKGKIPQLSDLRESGAIEQDADIVMFIHHPVDASSGQVLNYVDIAKHRGGRLGTMKESKFFPNIQKWMNKSEADAYMGVSEFKPFDRVAFIPDPNARIETQHLKPYDKDDLPF